MLKDLWRNLKERHLSYTKRGVYGYMGWTTIKMVLLFIVILVPLILIFKYLIDLNAVFQYIIDHLPDWLILVIFFVSESFLGLIPPDLFVIWTTKFNSPFLFLTILGVISYIGGALSYLFGYWLSKRPKIKAYSERVLSKYMLMVRKWGGAFIVISALFPFSPFSMVVIAVSLFKYPFNRYLFFGIARIIRFLIQGILYLKILNMDTFFDFLS